jgi:hypothetical protein
MVAVPYPSAMTWVRRIVYGTLLTIAAATVISGTAAASGATQDTRHAIAAQAATPSASPHPSATTAPPAPQQAGSPFPWDTLITALSTLAAGFGGIWLTDYLGAKRSRNQQLLDRYAALASSLDQLIRLIRHPDTVNLNELPPTVGAAIGLSVGSVQRSYAPVYLTAPQAIKSLAEQAWKAAWDLQLWLDSRDQTLSDQFVRLVDRLDSASGDFAKAVRAEAK